MAIDLKVISENLAELLTSVVNTTTKFYDIFVNPVPKDVTIDVFNNENKLVKQTIPNLAKSRQPLVGDGNPEGSVVGNLGELYLDAPNSILYAKITGGTGTTTGWQQVATTSSLVNTINANLPLEKFYALNNAGTVELLDNRSYLMSPVDNFTFTLPTLAGGDFKMHRIHVQMSILNSISSINLGTVFYEPTEWYIDNGQLKYKTPNQMLNETGTFFLDYEFSHVNSNWILKVQRATNVWL